MAYNILVVDDSTTSRKVILKALRMTGIEIGEVHEAGNGEEALETLRDQWIDLVLSDLNMPSMTGGELVERMAEDDLLEKTPVILITSDRNQKRLSRLVEKGARAWLNKPFHPEALRDVILKALESLEGGRG